MVTATHSEAMKEYARNAGQDKPERAWILTPWDTWERNPSYSGPPVRHPEDYDVEDEGYPPPCSNPGGHEFVCSGTEYGGDDESYHGEGRCYCQWCGADGDA